MSLGACRSGRQGSEHTLRFGRVLQLMVCLSFCSGAIAGSSPDPRQPAQSPVDVLRSALRAALVMPDKPDTTARAAALRAIVGAPEFTALAFSEQHAALAAAASDAYSSKDYKVAQLLAIRATGMSEQSVDDWTRRLHASLMLHDGKDEVESLLVIARQWRQVVREQPTRVLLQVDREGMKAGVVDRRREMLQLLLDSRSVGADDPQLSTLWVDLALLLLEAGKRDEAALVASHITAPFGIVALQVDARYKPIRHLSGVPGNPRKAALQIIERLDQLRLNSPRSLALLGRLANAMIVAGQFQKVLDVTDPAVSRVESAAEGSEPPYDDLAREYPWILDHRARALSDLGRFDVAIAEYQRAIRWVDARDGADHASLALNLAVLLYEMGRSRDALDVPVPGDKLSAFGHMVLEQIHLNAAVQLGDSAQAGRALQYIQDHAEDSPQILEDALLRVGRDADAAKLLVERLADSQRRTAALVDLQDYLRHAAPPLAKELQDRRAALRERSEVRAAISRVGTIERYDLVH